MTENFIVFFSTAILIFFIANNYHDQNYPLFYNNIVLLLILVTAILVLRKKLIILAHFTMVLMAIGVLSMVYINKGQDYIPIWSFVFIYFAMVMYGHKYGLIISVLYCSALLGMMAFWLGDTISIIEFLRFSTVVVVTITFSFLSEFIIMGTLNDLRKSQRSLQAMALTDALTDVNNRRKFDLAFTPTVNIAKRNAQLLAYVMIDIDFFKRYNDYYGHQQGDEALIAVAQALKNKMKRANDAIFRIGGEEFALLFTVKNKEQATNIANDVIYSIEALKISHKKSDVSEFLTISAGLFLIEIDNTKSKDDIYKACDNLLYEAKNTGRNQVVTMDIT